MSDAAAKFDAGMTEKTIEGRLNAVSPGKWRTVKNPTTGSVTSEGREICFCSDDDMDTANAEFIAHAPEDIRWLLQRVEDLEDAARELDEAREG